ncbi:polyprenyl synthetase family protein [Coxiella endosymbiont of Amblyomma nuttalli]|uniref:polyprenyl synthetase family protein n=1 Tax=Coxiella endosymbiont of Amblyomma nuttalli TaxID=2749996 RepID=UPI001BA4E415|nr:polyprenyl synthetase family protein [Coxiella endosymbiont of Amblyomma nuttalli]QTS84023.1 All-trans-nonaprenyl-diphosphate synthase (geranyl-diphosphate specific) [Coxiella endosymbiont of Amblyomma nuttalli]
MKTSKTVFLTSSTIENLRQPVENDFQAIDALILSELSSHVPLVQTIIHHIVHSGGKRLRPLVVLLTAHACGYNNGVEHQELAVIIEFIHTATLLHDDVIDKSDLRRGEKTANAIWGNQASVLVGDFLYSRAFQILARRSNVPVMKVLANTTNQIAEGEIWQLMNQNDPDVDESIYYEVIRRKTAQLFSAGTEIGAIISTEEESLRKAMTAFGLHLGLAYQIIDDLLDYSEDASELDKNVGDDLAEGKATLPLIYAKQKTKPAQAKLIREAIKQGGLDNLKIIMQLIDETKARKYTQQCAIKEAEKARTHLQALPLSIYRDALESLTKFVIYRRY